jgi:selenocysteine lyase/cysteine desulfurase
LSAAHEHETVLLERLLAALEADDRVTLYGHPKNRTATVYFTVAGESPEQTVTRLAASHINAWHGHNYAWEVTRALGIRDTGSAVRVSLAHYTNSDDIDRLLAAI